MPDSDTGNNNQRSYVTNKLLQRDIQDISKQLQILPEMQDKLHDIDKQVAVVCTEVENNKENIDDLKKRSNINDVIIGTGTIVAGVIGSLFGGKS